MKAVIVEDEYVAARSLERLIKATDQQIEIVAVLQSVSESVAWFTINPHPDVVFMDIHLADGDSFTIFEKTTIHCPIIYTTAYDEYALKAFEVNSIDYLLKPITRNSIEKALEKLSHYTFNNNNAAIITQIVHTINESKRTYRKHFLIPHKDKLIPLAVDTIAYIYSAYKMAKIVCYNNDTYTMDVSLDELLRQLNPSHFYRANRQYIVAHQSIVDLSLWFNGKLSVNLSIATPERIIVSSRTSTQFKEWYMENSVR